MTPYSQHEIDQRFNQLIQECRVHGLHAVAAHFEKSQGMQRVHAIRFLEQMFETHKKNMARITFKYLAAVLLTALAALALILQAMS